MKYHSDMKLLIVLSASVVIFSIVIFYFKSRSTSELRTIYIAGNKLEVEEAKTLTEQARGLMFRETLPENQGMLFIFKSKGTHKIWMQNTYTSLDAVWLDNNHKIVHIEKDLPPCNTITCSVFGPSKSESYYIVEMNAGWIEKNNIKIGDFVDM